jgi:hypothetical protein
MLELMDAWGRRYGQPPSALLEMPAERVHVELQVLEAGMRADGRRQAEAARGGGLGAMMAGLAALMGR